jgi:hypothetical protein
MEVMLVLALSLILLIAVYRFFFAEVKVIRHALEHIEVNENARLFLARFGNDARNANWLEYPPATVREGVPRLLPAAEGRVCQFLSQVYDFSIKPPDPRFLRQVQVTWRLKKAKNGSFELYRDIHSEVPATPGGPFPYKATTRVCEGVKEIFVFSSIRRNPRYSSFPGLPFKNTLIFDPYDIDGTGPQLVHVRVTFMRRNMTEQKEDRNPLTLRTCFAMRGRLNGVNP